MTARIKSITPYSAYDRTRRIKDFCIITSVALWAAVLGFGPILTYRLLLG